MKLKTFLLYGGCIFLIGSWWGLAFNRSIAPSELSVAPESQHHRLDSPCRYLSTLDRKDLHQALLGDFSLMATLIASWEMESMVLIENGDQNIRRLQPEQFQRALWLADIIRQKKTTSTPRRLFPQTYVSASFLLAIARSEEILALPKGLRDYTSLYPVELTKSIPHETHQFNEEMLASARPDAAFVSSVYSHPAVIQTFSHLNIPLLKSGNMHSFQDIQNSLLEIGAAAHRTHEAELLALFMEAAVNSIDNRLALQLQVNASQHVLYLHYRDQFYFPSNQPILMERLKKFGISLDHFTSIPLPADREKILQINPETLIISVAGGLDIRQRIFQDPFMRQLKAFQNHRIYFVDDDVQESPTQLAVLANYDLAAALMENTLKKGP